MHALMPTINSIWSSLKATNKKNIIITGNRGSGKTTLINKLITTNRGFTTHAIPGDKVILRFNNEYENKKSYIIGTFSEGEGTNRMQPVISTLGELAKIIEEDTRLNISDNDFYAIDEIGYLEDASPLFCKTIIKLFDKFHIIATVRKQNTRLITSLISRDDVLLIDLDNPFGNPGCVIMASGLGSRFGQNKLMADLNNQPLIHYILSTTQQIFENSVVVTRHTAVENFCNNKKQDVILHNLPNRNDTTRLGTQYLISKSVDNITFFQGDQPFVSIDTIMAMLLVAQNSPNNIVRLTYKGTDCSPILFPSRFFDELTKLPDKKGGNYIAKSHPDAIIKVEAEDIVETIDIDTKEDIYDISTYFSMHKS